MRVLFVCLGNICRSPTAHGVFVSRLQQRGLEGRVEVDSAGTSNWHIGKPPDPRTVAVAAARGVDLSPLRARQVSAGDFDRFDYILAMDQHNLADLQALAPVDYRGHLGLLLAFDSQASLLEVPDPYYGGEEGFEQVVSLIEAASDALLDQIAARLPPEAG